jgi:hypothetical protein
MAVLVVAAPTASDAQPLPTCKAMCQRLADCKMPSYTKACLDSCKQHGYEASEEGRAQLLTLTRYSCQQIQSALAGTDGHQPQRSSTQNAPARTPSTRTVSNDDEAELDRLDKELNEAEQQLGEDEQELERRSSGARGPVRGAGAPARGPADPVRGGRGSAGGRPAQPEPRGSAQSSGGYDDGHASGPAAGRYQGCSSVCGRILQCGLMAFDRCDKMCEGAARYTGHHWRVEGSCSEIKKALVTDQWMCTAEASHGTAVGNGPYAYSTTSLMGAGNTRDQAAREALRNCNAIQGSKSSLAWLGGQTVDGGMCQVTRCVPPGTPL